MKIAIYDAAEKSPVGLSWALGARLFKLLGYFKHVIPAHNWSDALRDAIALSVKTPVTEIQFWGHGSPGGVYVAGEPLEAHATHRLLLTELQHVLAPDAFVWFRTCASFAGASGRTFAVAVVSKMKCRVAGSTFNIGFPWHSGQHSLRPGETPYWGASEGLNLKNEPLGSRRSAPNTIVFNRMSLPESW